jgi:hypothetical protein
MKSKSYLMFKRVIGLSLGILMILAILAPSQIIVYADTYTRITDKATGFEYDGTGEIITYDGTKTDIVIPEKLGKVTIKYISDIAFCGNTKIKSVTFPNTMTVIGHNAFEGCSALTTVKFPKTLKTIEYCAFFDCTSLKGVIFPDGLKSIGYQAFANCKAIKEIKIPESVTTLEPGAFYGTSITAFKIPNDITSISGALIGNTQIKTFVVPKTIKTIGEDAFSGCTKLTSLTVLKNVKEIGNGAFDECPLLTVYGENGSEAQVFCLKNEINFVDIAIGAKPVKQIILPNPIVMPSDTKSPTVKATPSKTKIALNNAVKNLEAYTISGEDYCKITDLSCLLSGTSKQFGAEYNQSQSLMQLTDDRECEKKAVSIGDGKEKQAARVYPTIYWGTADISRVICVYSINGEDYYKLSDTLDIINCGIIKNTKTGVLNLRPDLAYEPLNSPVFQPVPKGNATFMKIQKGLYDAYLSGKDEAPSEKVTVPDNTVFYVPRGISYNRLGSDITYLGNNSSFIVKGSWTPEYPDKCLFPTSKTTKNAMLCYGYNYVNDMDQISGANNNLVYTSGKNNFEWGIMQFTSTNISYGNVKDGVQSILFNFTRDKRDPASDVYVYMNVVGGESYGYLYRNVKYSIDLSSQLATVVAKNVGKKATINKITVQNCNGISYSNSISLPVNWTISTSGPAPTDIKSVVYADSSFNNSLVFSGLSQKSYIAKCKEVKDYVYKIISPKNNYTYCPHELAELDDGNINIIGEYSNIVQYTGIKAKSGKDNYSFFVSPFSKNLDYVNDYDTPKEASLSVENKKTYLNISYGKTTEQHPFSGSDDNILVKYHKKGDPSDVLGDLYTGDIKMDKVLGTGTLDLTQALTDLKNKSGAISIDSLYVHSYEKRVEDDFIYPSLKATVVPCDITPAAADSVKLGKDTMVYITANSLQSAGTAPITAPFVISNSADYFSSLQFSPAGKNQWGPNLLKRTLTTQDNLTLQIAFNPASPQYDIKGIVEDQNTTTIFKGANFSGITKAGGKIQLANWDIDYDVAIVTNNVKPKPFNVGASGSDTIDVVLIPGSEIKTFDIANFSLVLDDNQDTPVEDTYVKITNLSQTTGGNAKLTFTRYFELDPEKENRPFYEWYLLKYKGNLIGRVNSSNFRTQ